jgi:acetyl-CoA synthetase
MTRAAHLSADRGAWDRARSELAGLPAGGVNIAYEAVDRHVADGHGDRVALRWLGRNGSRRELTYADLAEASNRFASILAGLGVRAGDAVVVLLDRVPELHVSVLGSFKHRAVVVPLFSAFGPDPVRDRIAAARGRVLVTTPTLYARRVAPVRDQLPTLEQVLLVGDDASDDPAIAARALAPMLAAASPDYAIGRTDPSDPAILHFTSGTTGTPKGAVHVHDAVAAHRATALAALGLEPGDVYWCTADPGWVTGMSYGIIAPLCCGVTCIVDEADFDVRRWWSILADERVQVWYTAPTAIRMLLRAGAGEAAGHDLSSLRLAASVGEPLHADAVHWGEEVLGTPFHDTWWQTETGAIMIANPPTGEVRAGSMGRPLPGVEVAVLRRAADAEGGVLVQDGCVVVGAMGEQGHLALRPPWPSMFRGYLDQPERYAGCFVDAWYVTGDLASIDEAGWVWFVGRADDLIKSAGHLIGPFEVESALLEHPAVVEAGVIGVPDPMAGEIVKAFVSLADGVEPDDQLVTELLAHARRRLGPAVAPRRIAFDQHLPRTRSGKIARRVLRARELGLPTGDVSTLEQVPT